MTAPPNPRPGCEIVTWSKMIEGAPVTEPVLVRGPSVTIFGVDPTKDPDIRRIIRAEFAEEIIKLLAKSTSIQGLMKTKYFTEIRALAARETR